MQRKLKGVFRKPSRKSPQEPEDGNTVERDTLKHVLQTNGRKSPLAEHHHHSSSSSRGDAPHHSRSRPVSSMYDSGSDSHYDNIEPALESITNDYKAYLPAISSIGDPRDEDHVIAGHDNHTSRARRYEEDVADRNILQNRNSLDACKRKPLPPRPDSKILESRDPRRYSVGHDIEKRNSSHEPQHKNDTHEVLPEGVDKHDAMIRQRNNVNHGGAVPQAETDEIQKVTEQLLDGFVDLRNTVDVDKDVKVEPLAVHEIIRPHEHEIVQQNIYREIHNYEYHHRIQPVYHLEVLPPRHWIPNPNSDGLIEVSADQLPFSTGFNQQWEIVQQESPQKSSTITRYRTEPEIIHHPPYITAEGFERKETTILYPPTLEDLSDYDGLVQPVHFDHKTGKRWMGEIVTMDQVQKQIDEFRESEALNMNTLRQHLPEVAGVDDGPIGAAT